MLNTEVDYRPALIPDDDRDAVTRLVSRECPDAELILDMLFGELNPAHQPWHTNNGREIAVSSAERARIRDLRRQGLTHEAIAKEVGRSRQTVSEALRGFA